MDKLTDLELLRIIAVLGSTSPSREAYEAAELNNDVEQHYPYKPLKNWKPMPTHVRNYKEPLFDKLLEEAKERNLIEWAL